MKFDPALTYSKLLWSFLPKVEKGHLDPLTRVLRYNYKIVKPRVNSTQFLKFFTNRVVNNWNNLPKEAVNAGSLNIFKNCVDNYFGEFMYSTSIEIA